VETRWRDVRRRDRLKLARDLLVRSPESSCGCTPVLWAAAWIFRINSSANLRHAREHLLGLDTKSNAPSDNALSVIEAPAVLCELTTITGRRDRRMICFRVVE